MMIFTIIVIKFVEHACLHANTRVKRNIYCIQPGLPLGEGLGTTQTSLSFHIRARER